jgi:TPR repeat protein
MYGTCLVEGVGVAKDIAKGVGLLKRSADAGN